MNSRYEITNLLSKDFAGGIYEGKDTVLNRKIACRRFFNIVDNSGPASWEEEFTSFCHRLTALQHPNIAMMFDAGIDEEGPFIISQVLEGETLTEIIAKGPASEFEVFSFAQDMCEALTMIHSINETHGALIPSSIIRKSKAGGRYLHSIIDQGIAALIPIIQGEPYNGNNPALTSPEQLAGAPPTPVSDIFMLGQLCYTLAAQGHPYSQASIDEAITLHQQGDQKRIERLAPHIQQPLADWIHSLIVPDPAQRPASAAEAAKSLPACVPPRGQAHQAPPAQGTSSVQTPSPEPATAAPVFNTAAQAPPTTTLLQTSVAGPSTTNFMTATPVASTQSVASAPVENTSAEPVAEPVAGHQLASAKGSNKTILILVVAVAIITVIVAVFALSKDPSAPVTDGDGTTDKEGISQATPLSNTTITIAAPRLINKLTPETRKTPLKFKIDESKCDEYIINNSSTPSKFAKGSRLSYIMGVVLSPKSKFKTIALKLPSLVFTVGDKTFSPLLTTNKPSGAGKGEGFDLEVFISRNAPKKIALDVYFLQSNSDLELSLIERKGNTLTEKPLGNKQIAWTENGYYESTITINDPQPNCYYLVRLTAGESKASPAIPTFGFAATIVKATK